MKANTIKLIITLLGVAFWITVIGANYPSGWLSDILLERLYPLLKGWTVTAGFPSWLTGVLIDGACLAGAWGFQSSFVKIRSSSSAVSLRWNCPL